MSAFSGDWSVDSIASRVAEDPSQFAIWAEDVHLDTNIIPNTNLPEFLNNILRESQMVPRWVTHQNAPQFERYLFLSRQWVEAICKSINPAEATFSDDVDMSNEVAWSFGPVLGIILHDQSLQNCPLEPTKADRRVAVKGLMSYTWDFFTRGSLRQSQECTLQVPKNSAFVREVRVDSVVLILLKCVRAVNEAGTSRACSSLAARQLSNRGHLWVPHWVSQFGQNPGQGNACLNKVMYGLVSGLYQRRAFGFPSHFVFGTVHRPPSGLDILAATWVFTEGEGEAKSRKNMGHVGQPVDSGSKDQNTGEAHSELQGPATSGKIVVYHLKTFSMKSPSEMFQFYLLMRRIRMLGQDYKKIIEELSIRHHFELRRTNPEIYDWLPPPLPPKPRKRSRSESTQSSLDPDSVSEEMEERNEIDAVEMDVLSRRYVKRLKSIHSDAKVTHYLATSVHDEYEEIPDEVI